MEFRLLGPLEVRAGNGPVPLGGGKQRALLALLLLNANRVVPRERLIDELWGDDPPETAVTTVHVYVSRLRKVLPAGVLSTRAPGYVLTVEPAELDLTRFEELVSAARGKDPARASHLLREALALWRGPPLAEFEQEPFARAESRRLEDLRLGAVEARIEADLALGRHVDVVGELGLLIAKHPLRERLRGQLILALYRSGRQAEALDAYRDARRALDELGLEPSAALRQLERQVLARDPSLELPRELVVAPQLPGPLVPESPFPFVGRADELAILHELLDRAVGGEGSFVLLTGEPGAGKTRLVRELAREAVGAGMLVCYGTSSAAVTVPYQPIRDWLEFVLRVSDPDALAACVGDGGEELGRIAPAFAAPAGADEPKADRYLLQAAVADFLRRLSERRPLLLVAEDIHWSDAETLLLLARLARTAPEGRTLIVATFRQPGEEIQPELAETLAEVGRLEGITRVGLENLSANDVGVFVREATEAEATIELVTAIGELTDGTPLLVCELWRELSVRGALEISDERVHLVQPVAELGGPRRIHELMEQRLARLAPDTAALVELAAVAGPRFELSVIGAAAALDHGRLTAAVEQAVTSGIIGELPASAPSGRFTHELVRRAVYDRVSAVRRPELHVRVGQALEQVHAADPGRVVEDLAYHFTVAAPVAGAERAVDYNLLAADAAMTSAAYDEAAARLTAALDLGVSDPRQRARVQADLGYLLYESGKEAEAMSVLAASIDAASGLEERDLVMRALVQRAHGQLLSDPKGRTAEVIPIAEEAIAVFEELGDSQGLAMAERVLGEALGRDGRAEEAFAAYERARSHAEAVGDRVILRDIVGQIARFLLDGPTPAPEAIERLEALRASPRNDTELDAGVRRCLAYALAMVGRFGEAREHIEVASAETTDQTSFSFSSHWMAAHAKELAGDIAGAEQELIGPFWRMRDARGDKPESRAMRIAALLAHLYADQGRWNEAAEYLAYGQEVDRLEPALGKIYTPLRLSARARLAAHHGDLPEGLELARSAVDVAAQGPYVYARACAWVALAEVQRANGQAGEAEDAISEAVRIWEDKGNVVGAARVRDAFLTLSSEDG